MISLVYQKPISLLQTYEFTLTWQKDEETTLFNSLVTVSHAEGETKIMDISIEGDIPEDLLAEWNPEEALKQIMFELGEELNKLTKTAETNF